ncbi:MAG TPA: proteasome subunit alpha [Trebonia sp.]|jgi:proteasome alpha subunit|nr:proteasome subunit alpha [Trebonia sp.]
MPFYVSPEQAMRDKSEYARSRIARGRSCVALQYTGGILLVAPNPSRALHKMSELYDRIAFAAGGRYNEYEALRKAGITYADVTGYQFDRRDVTARGLANWYAQTLGTIYTESQKPYEVEIVVAEVGDTPADDQIYRITFDGSVSDEPGFVAFGGQADQVAAQLKEKFSDGMSLSEALGAALEALTPPPATGSAATAAPASNGELTVSQLEVAILDRNRPHRTFRRLRGPRLEELITAAKGGAPTSPEAAAAEEAAIADDSQAPGTSGTAPASPEPGTGGTSRAPGTSGDAPTGPRPGTSDGIPKPPPGK